MSNKPCKQCRGQVNRKKPGLQCGGFCSSFYHGQCLNLSPAELDVLRRDDATWTCPDCRASGRDRRLSQNFAPPMLRPVTPQGNVDASTDRLLSELREMKDEIRSLKDSVSFCSSKITDFQEEMSQFKGLFKRIEKLETENNQFNAKIENFSLRLNDLEQAARSRNLEIHGIPEKETENLPDIIAKIGTSIGHAITVDMIEYTHRVPSNSKHSPKDLPKVVVLGLSSKKYRDSIMTAVKNKRLENNSRNSGLAVPGFPKNIYINEHLTLANKILHKQAREAARNKNYEFVWVKNGSIFVRKSATAPVLHIKSSDFLNKM